MDPIWTPNAITITCNNGKVDRTKDKRRALDQQPTEHHTTKMMQNRVVVVDQKKSKEHRPWQAPLEHKNLEKK